jgi:hypothetical protein
MLFLPHSLCLTLRSLMDTISSLFTIGWKRAFPVFPLFKRIGHENCLNPPVPCISQQKDAITMLPQSMDQDLLETRSRLRLWILTVFHGYHVRSTFRRPVRIRLGRVQYEVRWVLASGDPEVRAWPSRHLRLQTRLRNMSRAWPSLAHAAATILCSDLTVACLKNAR